MVYVYGYRTPTGEYKRYIVKPRQYFELKRAPTKQARIALLRQWGLEPKPIEEIRKVVPPEKWEKEKPTPVEEEKKRLISPGVAVKLRKAGYSEEDISKLEYGTQKEFEQAIKSIKEEEAKKPIEKFITKTTTVTPTTTGITPEIVPTQIPKKYYPERKFGVIHPIAREKELPFLGGLGAGLVTGGILGVAPPVVSTAATWLGAGYTAWEFGKAIGETAIVGTLEPMKEFVAPYTTPFGIGMMIGVPVGYQITKKPIVPKTKLETEIIQKMKAKKPRKDVLGIYGKDIMEYKLRVFKMETPTTTRYFIMRKGEFFPAEYKSYKIGLFEFGKVKPETRIESAMKFFDITGKAPKGFKVVDTGRGLLMQTTKQATRQIVSQVAKTKSQVKVSSMLTGLMPIVWTKQMQKLGQLQKQAQKQLQAQKQSQKQMQKQVQAQRQKQRMLTGIMPRVWQMQAQRLGLSQKQMQRLGQMQLQKQAQKQMLSQNYFLTPQPQVREIIHKLQS